MTAQEKAKDLVNKYRDIGLGLFESKICAIIAVDEAILYHPISTTPYEHEIEFHKFWQKVKEEIIKQ